MLTRVSKRVPNIYHYQYRYFAAGSANDGFNERISKLRTSYPNLFNRDSFLSEQAQLLSAYKSSLSGLINEYDAARQSIDASTGEQVFMALDENTLLNDINTRNKPFYQSLSDNMDVISRKLAKGEQYTNKVIQLEAQQSAAQSIEEKNLKMIEIANLGDTIDHWQLSFTDPINDSSDMGLPISDDEVDQWVREQYHHAPDDVRQQSGSADEHKNTEEQWMRSLDDKLCDLLKQRDSNFDESKFGEFCDATNEMFHPHSIDHYGMSNYAKSLFRAALWQSKDRPDIVEQSIQVLVDLLDDGRDDDSNIMRGVYEQSPNTRFSQFVAFQLRITDPLYAAKLIQEIRLKLEEIALDRAKKDVLYELEVPYLQRERKELETELQESMSTNPANMTRAIDVLQEEEDTYNIEMASLENILDEILPVRLWGKSIDTVKQTIVSYATGTGSGTGSLTLTLKDIDGAIDNTLQSNCNADTNALSDEEILDISVKYHNSRHASIENLNFSDFLNASVAKRDIASVLQYRRLANKRLINLGSDMLLINLVKMLIEDGTAVQLRQICDDYLNIMKRFRGEIEGLVTSASELDENTFNEIKNAIESANPGKKITLERAVDIGLQSGFIVKAGVQRFDFSLATLIHQGRMAVGSV